MSGRGAGIQQQILEQQQIQTELLRQMVRGQEALIQALADEQALDDEPDDRPTMTLSGKPLPALPLIEAGVSLSGKRIRRSIQWPG